MNIGFSSVVMNGLNCYVQALLVQFFEGVVVGLGEVMFGTGPVCKIF